MPLTDILLLAAGAFLLWFGANWIVDSAAAIARRFEVSELVIGLSVVAMGTSAPEFLVTATAAFKDLPDISLSNVVGSNIFNLGLILGLMAVIRPIRSHSTVVWRDGLLLWLTTVLIFVLSLNGTLSRIEGAVLMSLLAGYLIYLFRNRSAVPEEFTESVPERIATWVDYPKLVVGFVGIALGGDFMVEGARALALWAGISEWVVGLTVVAAGTSMPEMVTCLAAAIKGRSDMLLGNLIGSDFFNFAGVLGLTCLLRPLAVTDHALPSLLVLIAMIALVLFFIRTGWRVSRAEGLILIAINLGRWAWDFSAA